MIVKRVPGNIFSGAERHIVFSVNTDLDIGGGAARTAIELGWHELLSYPPQQLGTVLSRVVDGRTFYAVVCNESCFGGWIQTPEVLRTALDALHVNMDEEIAIVDIGNGYVGQMEGADVVAIHAAMEESKKHMVLYVYDAV